MDGRNGSKPHPPAGARFYRCAFQVNPHDYAGRYRGQGSPLNETEYAAALIDKAAELGVTVLAVTDHEHAKGAESIRDEARRRGIHVFPGFELTSTEGIHVLCLYPPDASTEQLGRFLGEFGVHNVTSSSDPCEKPFSDLLACVRRQRGVSIAAHVTNAKGLFRALQGQSRIRAWRDENLHAVQIPGAVEDLPDNDQQIIENRNADYARDHAPEDRLAVAVVNACDVVAPDDLENPSATCWVKMSEVGIEGLRQAFLDPGSRIRLNSDPEPEDHAEFVEMSWQGGFLDGVQVRFNSNLNVLVGGRGSGKSTVVESLRYVLGLDPLGEDARSSHSGVLKNVLRSGTKISLVARSHRPHPLDYRIERTIPNAPVVRNDGTGEVLNVTPGDVFPSVEIYGQHEISELARSPEKLTGLLARFVQPDESLAARKRELRNQLQRSRDGIRQTREELARIEDQLAALPGLEETLKRYQDAGLEEDLKEKSVLVREERVLDTALERLTPIRQCKDDLKQTLPIDRVFLSPEALEDLPGKEILEGADSVLDELSTDLERVVQAFDAAIDEADRKLRNVRTQFEARKASVQSRYEQKLRDLQKSRIDGEEFIGLRRRIEELRPLTERQGTMERQETDRQNHRRKLLAEWEDVNGEEFRELDRASRFVTTALEGQVRVQVEFGGNREPLFRLLRDGVGGRLSEAIETLRQADTLSPGELVQACRQGATVLAADFGVPAAQAERLARASEATLMQIEELGLPSTTKIELNVAAPGGTANWQALDDLSTGQKATAVLLLLLLESDAPLVVDQPEDDLDNRFITEGIVPRMRDGKRRRQFLFSTHNANIPVLGDAELIMGLSASGEAGGGHATIAPEHVGSIDAGPVRALVEELLEGGQDAFERRRRKYGF